MIQDYQSLEIAELIDRLESQVADGKRVLLPNRVIVEEAEFLALLDQLRATIPSELQQARRVIQDRQKIILDAQMEAEKILLTARDRAEYLISEKGLTAEARYRSEDVLRQAKDSAQKSISEVDKYARRVLDQMEQAIRENLKDIESAKSALSQ
jgi:vacuolar-type H+-ATPase subunit H